MHQRQIYIIFSSSLFATMLLNSAYAQPVQNSTPALYLQYGAAEHQTSTWTIGTTLPWNNWSYSLGSGQVTGYWDLWGSHWSADYQGSNRSTWVVGAKPTFRWRPAQGQSPWFIDAGIGVSYATNRRYLSGPG